jgi:hypothetical protein
LIFDAPEFTFRAPPMLATVRRVLIKPSAGYPLPYPVTTSRELLANIISGIRRVTDADILLLDGTPDGSSILPIYKSLGYDFPRVLTLDVKDCIWVEVENPLPRPLVAPTFWIPNVVLSSDYLISVAPLKVIGGTSFLSIMNLLSLLPARKYGGRTGGWSTLYNLGINHVLTDLYFTLPFDLSIIEARQKFVSSGEPTQGIVEGYGKIFTGEPYQVDREVVEALNLKADYLNIIEEAKKGFET